MAQTQRIVWIGVALVMALTVPAKPQQQDANSANNSSERSVPHKPIIVPTSRSPVPQPGFAEASDQTRFIKERSPGNLSETNDSDHEDAGVYTDGGGEYTGVLALHAIYETGRLQLALPQNATRTQTLYAATTRPPNGSCLEMGTAYETPISQPTTTSVYVFDFCKSPPIFAVRKAVDAQFMSTYAGGLAQGKPAYNLAIFTSDSKISASSTWTAELYNYQTKKFDIIYTSDGVYTYDPRGWSIFETWFQEGQCSESLPPLGAAGLAYLNPSTKAWEPVAPTMAGLAHVVHTGGNCFVANHGEGPSYEISVSPTFVNWTVTSTGQ
jgi:hypothetical protein